MMKINEIISGTKKIIPTGAITNHGILEFIRKSAKTMDTIQRLYIIEHMSENSGSLLNEVLDMDLVNTIQKHLAAFSVKNAVIGEKYIPVSIDVYNDQVIVYDVIRNSPPKTKAKFGELVGENENEYVMKMGKDKFNYPITLSSASNYVVMLAGLFDTVENYEKFRTIMTLTYDKKLPPVDLKSVQESASGYIPSEKEKNDPRYKTGLTKDVKPDTIQVNAKKLGSKVSRAGIPPLLR
jgi:hypothetical protein